MRKYLLSILVSLLTVLGFSVRADVTAKSLVNRLDEVRGYRDQGFSFNITNVSYKKDKKPRTNTLSVKVYNDKSLIRFESPAREKGRAMLKEDTNMWLYIPGTRRVIRIAPSQRLIGEASNGDVVGTNFSRDYSAKIASEETIGGQDYWVLELNSNTSGVAYEKVRVWMTKSQGNQPLRGEFYSRSGRLLKTAFYKEYMIYKGELKLHKLLLVDALMEDNYTWMKFDDYQLQELDSAIFQKASLGRLN